MIKGSDKVDILILSEQRLDGWYLVVRVVPTGRRDLPDTHPDVQIWEKGPVPTRADADAIGEGAVRTISRRVMN